MSDDVFMFAKGEEDFSFFDIPVVRDGKEKFDDKPIVVVYTNNYDIYFLHNQVKTRMSFYPAHVKSLMKKKEELEHEINKSISITDMITMKGSLNELDKEIDKYKYIMTLDNYERESNKILKKISSLSVSQNTDTSIDQLIECFFCCARKYVPLFIEREKKYSSNDRCTSCGNQMADIEMDMNNYKHCNVCSTDNKIYKVIAAPREYDVLGNFLKAFRRYIGIQPVKFNIDIVCNTLDTYFLENGKKPGEYYRSLPLTSSGYKKGTNHLILTKALEEIGYNGFYKDWMYIGHHYYGWKLPELRHLLDIIKKNFSVTQAQWDLLSATEKEGSSSISTQYRLCQELRMAGHNCHHREFRLPQQIDTVRRYDRVFKLMCERAGLKFIPIFEYNDENINYNISN